MQFLRDQLDKIGTHFHKGGKLEPLYPVYEMHDTILFTPGEVTGKASHVRDGIDQKRMMITVVMALMPCVLWAMYNTGFQAAHAIGQGASPWDGWQTWLYEALGEALGFGYARSSVLGCMFLGALYFLPVFAVVGLAGAVVEVTFAVIRGHEVTEGFLVSWFLIALILPPTIPLWQAILGTVFGLVIGKEVFGGVGMNIWNPALVARAFLFFAYPAEISGDAVWTAAVAGGTVDGFSGATWLAQAAVGGVATLNAQSDLFWDAIWGFIPGSMGETSVVACLLGAGVLLVTRIGSYRTMLGVVVGTVVMSYGLNAIGSDSNPMFSLPFWWHMVLGGWAFGTVFMATDPVSSSFSEIGKWIYGFSIGVLVVLVRVVNPAYPEGMMLAILFMNMFAPLIDHFVVQANIKRRKARYESA
ncbi:MAG: NADH:ubiquinone reductase (Na(+)-transporting) subunit B [Nannocystaceae bacterium]